MNGRVVAALESCGLLLLLFSFRRTALDFNSTGGATLSSQLTSRKRGREQQAEPGKGEDEDMIENDDHGSNASPEEDSDNEEEDEDDDEDHQNRPNTLSLTSFLFGNVDENGELIDDFFDPVID